MASVTLSGTGVVTAPAGWVEVQNQATSTALRTVVYQRVAAAGDPVSWSFTWPTAKRAVGSMLAYQNAEAAAAVETSAKVGTNSAITNHAAPSVTSSGELRRLVNVYGVLASTTLTPAAGSVERVDVNTTGSSSVTQAVSDRAIPASGATGTTTATSATAGKNALVSILIRPKSEANRYAFSGGGDSADMTLDTANNLVESTISLPGGAMFTSRSTGNVWSYPNIHGDIAAVADTAGVKQGATSLYDPYGQLIGGVQPDNSAGRYDYGWLGKHQRGLEHTTGLQPVIEMGARQYSPRLGRFLEVDPIEGGSANDYDYVNGDPINAEDLNGMFKCRKQIGQSASVGGVRGRFCTVNRKPKDKERGHNRIGFELRPRGWLERANFLWGGVTVCRTRGRGCSTGSPRPGQKTVHTSIGAAPGELLTVYAFWRTKTGSTYSWWGTVRVPHWNSGSN